MKNMNDDLISRQAAKNKKVYSEERHEYVIPVAEIDWLPSAQPEQIARDIATIIENERDMRVILQNTERTETHSCDYQRTETHDLVSRDAVIKAILQLDNLIYTVPDYIDAVRSVPSAEPESRREWYMKGYRDAQPRWISVEEALPEDDKRVLCQMKGGELVFGFHHGKYWAYGHKPIAWFPLPEPYAERRHEGGEE